MIAARKTLSTGIAVVAAAMLPAVAGATQAVAAPETETTQESVSPRAACNDFSTFTYANTSYVVHLPSIGYQTHNTNCTLVRGNTGPGVFVLQGALNACYNQGLQQDAVYGPATEQAVRNVQNFHQITPDGDYGPRTRDHMAWPKYTRGGTFVGCWF